MKIAIFGGTGKLGKGLARRIVATVHEVALASRDISKAETAARAFTGTIQGLTHDDAARWCDLAILATPYAGHSVLLESLRDGLSHKIVIDATVPLDPANPLRLRSISGNSAAEETASTLPDSRVFGAFHTVSHRVLEQTSISCDVLAAGGEDGKAQVFEVIRAMNLRPIHAGPLAVSGLLEQMTALLISINRQNKVRESGIHIVGIPG